MLHASEDDTVMMSVDHNNNLNSEVKEFKSIIECGILLDSQRLFRARSEFFNDEVDVFMAVSDERRQVLYRSADVARHINIRPSRLSMYLSRSDKRGTGIFQATDFLHKSLHSRLKLGTYFVSEEVCNDIKHHFAHIKKRQVRRYGSESSVLAHESSSSRTSASTSSKSLGAILESNNPKIHNRSQSLPQMQSSPGSLPNSPRNSFKSKMIISPPSTVPVMNPGAVEPLNNFAAESKMARRFSSDLAPVWNSPPTASSMPPHEASAVYQAYPTSEKFWGYNSYAYVQRHISSAADDAAYRMAHQPPVVPTQIDSKLMMEQTTDSGSTEGRMVTMEASATNAAAVHPILQSPRHLHPSFASVPSSAPYPYPTFVPPMNPGVYYLPRGAPIGYPTAAASAGFAPADHMQSSHVQYYPSHGAVHYDPNMFMYSTMAPPAAVLHTPSVSLAASQSTMSVEVKPDVKMLEDSSSAAQTGISESEPTAEASNMVPET